MSLVGQVRRQGEQTNRTVHFGRHLSGAALGDWVLAVEDGGQCWAVTLLGVGPTAYAPNPDVGLGDGGGSPGGALVVPPTWAGTTVENNLGSASDNWGWQNNIWRVGRYKEVVSGGITIGDSTYRCIGLYQGLEGLDITAASLTVKSANAQSTTGTRMRLLMADTAPPASPVSPDSMVLVDSVDGPDLPTSGWLFDLPAAWMAHLSAGTANALGMSTSGSLTQPTIEIPSLQVTYV